MIRHIIEGLNRLYAHNKNIIFLLKNVDCYINILFLKKNKVLKILCFNKNYFSFFIIL